jgi:predicted enzyme related to lactoylglutathione lyase
MPISARYTHTNIVARDWRGLARFYAEVFGCVPVPPERDISGRQIEEATGIPRARLRGMHLRLPGYGPDGPTLEIFQYEPEEHKPKTAANRPGVSHIAFAVDDVEEAMRVLLLAGGGAIGRTVRMDVPGVGTITFVYATDPEGNIIELQNWSK